MPGRSPAKKRICIVGYPRSGTGYMSKLMQAVGFDVSHELQMGEDGISSWLFAPPPEERVPEWGPSPREYTFNHLVYVTRHPIKVISSAHYTLWDESRDHILNMTGLEGGWTLASAVRSLVIWHKMIMKRKPDLVVRVEEAERVFIPWLKNNGYRVGRLKRAPPTNYNTRKHKNVSWEQVYWAIRNGRAVESFLEMTRAQGYRIAVRRRP